MKRIKIMILICIVILIIILICIGCTVFYKKVENDEIADEYGNYGENHNEEYVVEEEVKEVTDRNNYYIVSNSISEFFEYVNMISTNPLTDLEKEDSDFAISGLIKMLSSRYINEFEITNEKIIADYSKYINCSYNIEKMYVSEDTISTKAFLVEISIDDLKDNIFFIVVIDSENGTFEIYGDDYVKKYGYDKNKELLKDFQITNIEKNTFNKIKNDNITDQDMAINYFNDYKYNILNNIEKAYNSLDEEYRNKRFGSLEEFTKYIQDNITIFRNITIEQYICDKYEDYTEYICRDQNENIYVFKETAIMNYTLQLDTYTMPTDNFIEEYENGNVEKKVTMNIGKFIDMINNFDYKSAYNVLNQSFKEKYFKTEEEFKQYMKNTYYECNAIDLKDFSNENGTYVYTCIMRNKFYDDTDPGKDINIIMRLKNGTDFEMSFEVY